MTDLERDIDRCLETVEVLKATLPGFEVALGFLELTLEECKAIENVPTLENVVPMRRSREG